MKALAAGAAGLALVLSGGLVATELTSDTAVSVADTVTVTTPIPTCTLVGPNGQIANPCVVLPDVWALSFRNGLGTMAYYPKWKRDAPGDYGRVRDYAVSGLATPQPAVNTAFGAVVRWSVEQCRTWAPSASVCALP